MNIKSNKLTPVATFYVELHTYTVWMPKLRQQQQVEHTVVILLECAKWKKIEKLLKCYVIKSQVCFIIYFRFKVAIYITYKEQGWKIKISVYNIGIQPPNNIYLNLYQN